MPRRRNYGRAQRSPSPDPEEMNERNTGGGVDGEPRADGGETEAGPSGSKEEETVVEEGPKAIPPVDVLYCEGVWLL